MKTEKLSEYLEKLSRNYYEKSGARDIYCYRDKLYKYCQITTDSLKLEFVYSFKGSENYPLSTLSCRVYLDGNSPYFFEIQELIDYLEIYDFHCYCFPYIESAARMKACFNYITDFIEYHLEEIASLKGKEDKLVKRKIDEIRAVYGFNEELIPSDKAGKESFFNNIFKHYSHFLVKRYSSEPAYLAFVNGEYAEAYEKYKKLEKNQYDMLRDDTYTQAAVNLEDYGISDGIYGYVAAKTINMRLPIYLGANSVNMSYGAAHMSATSLPIGGKNTNTVLAGHTGYIGRIFFDNLRNLKIGDKVSITNYWDTLDYKVVETKVNKPNESGDCYLQKGRDLLTMFTCISDGNGGFDRYYVICERVS